MGDAIRGLIGGLGVANEEAEHDNQSDANRLKGILEPGGEPIGEPGSREGIRELPGGQAAAEKLFDELKSGGTPMSKPGYPGKAVELPDGGFVGYRPDSKSGSPAIDINVPGVGIDKIHFTD